MDIRVRTVLEKAARLALLYLYEKAPTCGEPLIFEQAAQHLKELHKYSQEEYLQMSAWVKEVRTRWTKEGK